MTAVATRWQVMLLALAGQPALPLPALPGRRHECHDECLSDDDLAAATPRELAAALGISRAAAIARILAAARRIAERERAEAAR